MNESRPLVHAPAKARGALARRDSLGPAWCAADLLVLGGNALLALTIVVLAARVANASAYLMLQVALAALPYALARHAGSASAHRALWALLYDFCPLFIFIAVYFELDMLIPRLHPFADLPYDRWLQSRDVWLLGDPVAFVARYASAALSDVLTVCYWAYYVFPLLPVGVGMVLATFYLRYHYLADVAAAVLLAPLVWRLGNALERACSPNKTVTGGVGAMVRGVAGCEERPLAPPVGEDAPQQAVADRAVDPAPGVAV